MTVTVVEKVLRQDLEHLRTINAELLKALEAYAKEFGETDYYRAAIAKAKGEA